MATPARQSKTVELIDLNYSVPNVVEGDGSLTGAQVWGNPSPNAETQFGNSIAYAMDKSFNTTDVANSALPIGPVTAPATKIPAALYRLKLTGFDTIPFTGSDAGMIAELGNDADHTAFFPVFVSTGADVPIRIADLSAAVDIDMSTPILTTVTVAGLTAGNVLQLQAPFVATDGTRGFMLSYFDGGSGTTFLIPVAYDLRPTKAIAAPVFPPSTETNDRAAWMPDYIANTNRFFRLNLDGDGAISLFTFDIDIAALTITPTQIASVPFSFFTTEEQNVIFDSSYGPMIYMTGPGDPDLTYGICWMDQTDEGLVPNLFYFLAWDASTWTTFSYTGTPFWPNGRFTDVFGPAGTLVGDSTEVEPPQIFPLIDRTTNPARHWFVRSPYVDPTGIGAGPWSTEAETWNVYSSLSGPPAAAPEIIGTHVGFVTAGHFGGGTK